MSTGTVVRHLPFLLRSAGRTSTVAAFGRALGRSVETFGTDTGAALEAHYPDSAALDDLARLGAWFELAPWSDEDHHAFRRRLRTMAGIYRRGAATAARLLDVVAVACDAPPVPPPTGTGFARYLPPRRPGPVGGWLPGTDLATTRFQTLGVFRHRGGGEPFAALVEDLPPVTAEVVAEPDAAGELWWHLDNELIGDPADDFADPPSPERGCTPRFVIAAGTHPVRLPVLVQRSLRRAILVNATVPAGGALAVDLRDDSVTDLATGDPVAIGPVDHGGAPAPALLFGSAAVVGLSRVDPDARHPGHHLRWYRRDQLAPNAPLTAAPLPPELPWPDPVPLGLSHWNLQLAQLPPERGRTEAALLHTRQCTATDGPARVTVRWDGRRLGTFTVRLDERDLDPAGNGPLRERQDWLVEQIQRLKLAGTIYIPPAETAAGGDPTWLQPAEAEGGDGPGSGEVVDPPSPPPPAPEALEPGGMVSTRVGRHAIGRGLDRLQPVDHLRWRRERELPLALDDTGPSATARATDELRWRVIPRDEEP